MFNWLKRRQSLRLRAQQLYGSIVTQARSPVLFDEWRVPDDPSGRFEMITLHLVFVVRALEGTGRQGALLARALLETFFFRYGRLTA